MAETIQVVEQDTVLAVDTVSAAAMLGISPGTLENWRYDKTGRKGPRWSRLGRKVVYPVAELQRFLEENTI